jgi:hypothetical protein
MPRNEKMQGFVSFQRRYEEKSSAKEFTFLRFIDDTFFLVET